MRVLVFPHLTITSLFAVVLCVHGTLGVIGICALNLDFPNDK